MNAETQTSKTVVRFPNNVEKVFSPRGKIFTDSTITDSSLTTSIYLNKLDESGLGISETVSFDFSNPEHLEFIKKLAARGAEDVIKSAIAGLTSFEDTVNEQGEVVEKGIFTIVNQKLEELKALDISTRKSGTNSSAPLTKLERAYAKYHNIDINSTDGIVQIKEWYNAIPKENRVTPQIGDELYFSYLEVEDELEDIRIAAKKEARRIAMQKAQEVA